MTQQSPRQTPLSFTPSMLDRLRSDAKRIRKAENISHSQALDQIAVQHGFKNWSLLHRSAVASQAAAAPQEPAAPARLADEPTSPARKVAHLPASSGLQIRMDASRTEVMVMKSIVERYERLVGVANVDLLSTMMDLEACHCNGCPLDLISLLEAAGDADLAHDVAGITRHLNRETGRLEDYFRPRYAA